MESFSGQRVLVMGLGRFGGGLGVTRWLARQGATITVTDSAPAERLAGSIDALRDLIESGRVALRLGGHEERDFTSHDLVIANPAVPRPWENPLLSAARAAGVPITTEIRLVTERLDRNRVIGVTGSAGKSTTSAMIHHALTRLGLRAHLGGNIGGSLLDRLTTGAADPIGVNDLIVLELSSAQLHWLGAGAGQPGDPAWSPRAAVITNITPNHLDWHGTFEHYRESKMNITRAQGPGDVLIRSDEVAAPPGVLSLRVPGEHNQRNAWTACHAASAMSACSTDEAAAALADFPGLPHRLQLVAEHHEVRYYNDSKSTTPEATLLAVASFDDPARVHLIVGGSDKGADLSPIARLAPKLGGMYAIGLTGRRIIDLAERVSCIVGGDAASSTHHAVYAETLDRAVSAARRRLRPGDVLLLSPGCASFDQFANYEARGEAFAALARESCEIAHVG